MENALSGNSRRNFIKNVGVASAGWFILPTWVKHIGAPFVAGYPLHNIPIEKGLAPEWIKSLYRRETPTTYYKSKNELRYIGMPAGGLHAGTLYLGGDGRLWLWEIFNDDREGIDSKTIKWNDGKKERVIRPRDGTNYISPAAAENGRILAQGFAVKIHYNGREVTKELREEDWDEISFEATYPLAKVTYLSKDMPVSITLTGGGFFIPLSEKESALPATSIHIEVTNLSKHDIKVSLVGWLENGCLKYTAKEGDGQRRNTLIEAENYKSIYSDFVYMNSEASNCRDAGSMCLSMVDKEVIANTSADPFAVEKTFFEDHFTEATVRKPDEKLIGSLATPLTVVKAGASLLKDFVICWHFNHTLEKLHDKMPESLDGHYYGAVYKDAAEVMAYIGQHIQRLKSQTRLWQDTFYDSTLPFWFLERTFVNISTIATANTYRFASGRFWGWEGVNACPGTCTHVWQYGQTLARIFPALERETRAAVDLDIAMLENGGIRFRGEFETHAAIDGQAGTILRIYREHQMTSDLRFLKKNWLQVKKAVKFLFLQDKNGDGMVDTPLGNTLDAIWEGEIAWIVGLCIAAVKAAQNMADEMSDHDFEKICGDFVEKGCYNMSDKLFNGEYFIHRPDPVNGRKKLGSYNTCHIDQVYGQSWAFQVGLGRLWNKKQTLAALHSLWKYNFAPDVGPYISTHTGGRPYALEGEAGLIMNTNPKNEQHPYGDKVTWQLGYFHECMSGFEHQVASHMMAEGMCDEALVLTRSIHDRYHGAKRNPYNEIECSDHYARAMASYGTYITACGFEYHGPKGHIRFAPKIGPENFKAAFTSAEGWGCYDQVIKAGILTAHYKVHFGKLDLNSISFFFKIPKGSVSAKMFLDDEVVECHIAKEEGDDLLVKIKQHITVGTGQDLKIIIG